MKILLTFTGFHDPYAKGLLGQEEQAGPILSLVSERFFEHIILFSTQNTEKNTSDTKTAIISLYPHAKVEIREMPIDDPTDYSTIFKGLRAHINKIQNVFSNASYFISVASGTPHMHACWLLLAAGGEIPAHILNVRPSRFVTSDRPLVSEIDLTSAEFPDVRPITGKIELSQPSPVDMETTLKQLGIVGDHPAIRDSLKIGATLATSDIPIVLYGETGTGKELFARFIHRLSGRPINCFIALNCAAIPENLVESILFGHKKGSFTGAISDQIGKFDLANGGTLFLDELVELPLQTQAKLLRVLQDGLVEPVGNKKPHKVNVRIIAATNRDIAKAIKLGKFREDLYYRLNVGQIQIPPLRKRQSDIPKIALHVLDKINSTLKNPKRLSPDALKRLQIHSWPGNVRDLENVIERSARLTTHRLLKGDDLLISTPLNKQDPLETLPEPQEGFSIEEFLGSARKQLILKAIEKSGGNKSEAARLLKITPQAVHKFMRKN